MRFAGEGASLRSVADGIRESGGWRANRRDWEAQVSNGVFIFVDDEYSRPVYADPEPDELE
ncbi:MAG: hypothetical protein AAF602_26155, partial [Myxococcota bacterium]